MNCYVVLQFSSDGEEVIYCGLERNVAEEILYDGMRATRTMEIWKDGEYIETKYGNIK